MYLATTGEMAALDRRASEECGIPARALMESAGRSVAEAARRLVGSQAARAVVLAGKGSNGGDGLVAARLLHDAGWQVKVVLLARDHEITGDAAASLVSAREASVEIAGIDGTVMAGLRGLLAGADLIIDGLFGTGLRGPVQGPAGAAIEAMNACGRPVLAIDIPSGIHGDGGPLEGPAVRAAATVTMGLPKIGLILPPGAEYAGQIWVADIGHPAALVKGSGIRTRLVTREMVNAAIPTRRLDAHKGDFGRVFIVAGSVGHTGAAVLAALGALRGGAGLVSLGVPASVYPIVGPAVIEGMPLPLPDEDGAVSSQAAGRILELAATADAVACGPGLSTSPGAAAVVRRLVEECQRPLVLDADALNVLASLAGDLPRARAALVLTPHPGEMARLLRVPTDRVQADRLSAARDAASRFGSVVVLKGARTVVADPEGDAFVVAAGNPAMATGGMGDVLTGIMAALVGQGIPPVSAAWAGAHLHGLAGDLAAGARGPAGILAREVADTVPAALAAVRAGSYPEPVSPLAVP